jgi:hypothetical protein
MKVESQAVRCPMLQHVAVAASPGTYRFKPITAGAVATVQITAGEVVTVQMTAGDVVRADRADHCQWMKNLCQLWLRA